MRTREITSHELENIKNYGICLVFFYRNNCKDSQVVRQEIEKISEEGLYYGGFNFNIEQDIELAKSFGVDSTPTLLVLKGNEILGRETTLRDSDKIAEWAHFSVIMGW